MRSPRPAPIPGIKAQRVGLRQFNSQFAIRRTCCGLRPVRRPRASRRPCKPCLTQPNSSPMRRQDGRQA
eukprot:3966308-Alexandrium_andersonii.AAC.1